MLAPASGDMDFLNVIALVEFVAGLVVLCVAMIDTLIPINDRSLNRSLRRCTPSALSHGFTGDTERKNKGMPGTPDVSHIRNVEVTPRQAISTCRRAHFRSRADDLD